MAKAELLTMRRLNAFGEPLKYEDIFIRDYSSVKELRLGLNKFFRYYNAERIHQALDYATPDEVYYKTTAAANAA